MAIAVTAIAKLGNDSSPQSLASASISPGADCILVIAFAAQRDGSSTPLGAGFTVTSSASGPSWTEVEKQEGTSSWWHGGGIYVAEIGGSDPGSFVVTANFDDDCTNSAGAIWRVTGYDTGTPHEGSVLSVFDDPTDGAVTLTLGASKTPETGDAVLAFTFGDGIGQYGAIFAASGNGTWTEDYDYATGSHDYGYGNAGHRTGYDTDGDIDWDDIQDGATNDYVVVQCGIIIRVAASSFTGSHVRDAGGTKRPVYDANGDRVAWNLVGGRIES